MKLRKLICIAAASILVLSLVTAVKAEVRARGAVPGTRAMTRVVVDDEGSRGVWSGSARTSGAAVLNPDGDGRDDLWPSVEESSTSPHRPWAVWSRHNGTDYDLVWSRLAEVEWEPIRWVFGERAVVGDDLDADLAFSRSGRPYIVWWRDEVGRGTVYLSMFLDSRWMAPVPISGSGLDGRYPTVDVLDSGTLRVDYETPDGPVTQFVAFERPDTITDDINPLDHVRMKGEAQRINERKP